jgi:protein-disulfide isomerase
MTIISTCKPGAAALAALTVTLLLSGCSGEGPAAAAAPPSRPTAATSDIPEVLATIGDDKITLAEVRARVGDDLDKNETRYLRTRHRLIEVALQDLIRDRVLGAEAQKQGKTIDQLVAAETGTSAEPTDADIAAWYAANPARTGGRAMTQIREQIADFLRNERRAAAAKNLDARLKTEQKVTVNLKPFRLEFDNTGAATRGPANAPVTLIEFSDFQCPFCNRFVPTLKQVEEKYGDKVQVVYRQYPIPGLHPFAFKAAEASLCANDQGKFWEMHDLMFQEQNRLAVRDLKVAAGRLRMDQKQFDACLDSGRHTEQVQKDMSEGTRVGVTGTPAIFVNGIPLEGGAVPFDKVAEAIDRELAQAAP